jgi:hypothetical protein
MKQVLGSHFSLFKFKIWSDSNRTRQDPHKMFF